MTSFTESYEKVEITHDGEWRQWLHEHPDADPMDSDNKHISITLRDGYSVVSHDFTILEAMEVRDLINKAIAEYEAWQPQEKESI